MDANDRRNEHLKLVANWSNTVATAIMTAGVFIPITQQVYGILPRDVDPVTVNASAFICIGTAVIIHSLGHLFLGGLR